MLLRIRIHSTIHKVENIDQGVPLGSARSELLKTNLSSLLSSIYPDGISGSSNRGSKDEIEEYHYESGIVTSATVPLVSQVNITTPSPGQHPVALPFSREK